MRYRCQHSWHFGCTIVSALPLCTTRCPSYVFPASFPAPLPAVPPSLYPRRLAYSDIEVLITAQSNLSKHTNRLAA